MGDERTPPFPSAVLRLGPVLLLGAGASLACLKLHSRPFAWAALVWGLVFLGGMARTRQSGVRAALFTLAFLALGSAALETYLWHFEQGTEGPYYDGPYRVRDDVLGIVPIPSNRVRATLRHFEDLIYDTVYTIGADGLRISPGSRIEPAAACVLFFGGSYTFGEGLGDAEALPYRVEVATGGRVHTYNFGFHGYGPHQMLAALERGVVERVVHCTPTHVIYLAIPAHVARVAGLTPFGRHGPRYLLSPDGALAHAGHFDDEDSPPSPLMGRLQYQLRKSATYRLLERRSKQRYLDDIDEEDVRLLVAIVARSRRLVSERYPGAGFHVLLWWRPGSDQIRIYDMLEPALRGAGLQLHLVADILPGYLDDPSQYWLSPYDPHPNARAMEILSSWVVEHLLDGHAGPAAGRALGSRPLGRTERDLGQQVHGAPHVPVG